MDKSSVHLPNFITGYYGPRSSSSRAFQALVRGIGEAKSKHEEGRIIREEFCGLKEKLGQKPSTKQMREYLVRLIYCEMLGIDASELHIHGINFAQQKNLMDKRIGYLALSLFLHENHPLLVLLVNTLQRDLKSTNILEILCALTAVCKLINSDMAPTVLQNILALLDFKRDIIRKKAIMTLHCLYQKCPSMVPDIEERALKALKDKDFGVASSSLHIFHDLISEKPASFKHLLPVFVAFQQKIVSGKLEKLFDYHDIPCPWVQIKLLKILALLGADDQKASSQMYEVVNKTISSLNTNALIGYAIAYECCKTITIIYPNKQLISKAAKCVGLFLVAKNNDIKYLGITTLATLVQVSSSLATEPAYQRIVIDCLDDPDETIKRKTLDLLCRITNATNVETVCEKLIFHLRQTNDPYFRSQLVARVTELAERYAPDNSWYILTMNEVLELGGGLVRPEVAHSLMRLIAEGNDDEESDAELRRFAVLSYLELLENPVLPDILIQVICWVVGEYSYVASECEPQSVVEQLCALLDRKYQDVFTKRWIVSAIGKVSAQIGRCTDNVRQILESQSMHTDADFGQRVKEITQLTCDPNLMVKVLPVDASCEDLEVDSFLSFLDSFVADALVSGASPYRPKAEREIERLAKEKDRPDTKPALKYQPYEPPVRLYYGRTSPQHDVAERKIPRKTTRKNLDKPAESSPSLSPIVKGPWGPGGYTKKRGGSGSGSDSSSKSSGSERFVVVRTTAESTPSPLVFSQEDARKQQLASQLFKGVGTEERSPRSNRKPVSTRGTGRAVRPQTRNKTPWEPSDPGKPPPLPPRPGVVRGDADLLLNIEGVVNEDNKRAGEYEIRGPVTGLEAQRSDSAASTTESKADNPVTRDGNCEHLENICDVSMSEKIMESVSPVPDHALSEVSHKGFFCRENCNDKRETTREAEMLLSKGDDQKDYNSRTSLLDADVCETFGVLSLTDDKSLPLALPEELQHVQHYTDPQELCWDANLRVTLRKVYEPDKLVLVVYLTNQSQGSSSLTDVVSTLEPPSNLRPTSASNTENIRWNDRVLETLKPVSRCILLTCKSPAMHMNFGGKITYKDSTNTSKNVFFNHTLPMSDLLRPLELTTEEFGTRWAQPAFEKRGNLSSPMKTCQEFLKWCEDNLMLYPVGIIGSEAIASGTVLGTGTCLLHASLLSSGTLELWIKTNSQLLSEAIMKTCMGICQR